MSDFMNPGAFIDPPVFNVTAAHDDMFSDATVEHCWSYTLGLTGVDWS